MGGGVQGVVGSKGCGDGRCYGQGIGVVGCRVGGGRDGRGQGVGVVGVKR